MRSGPTRFSWSERPGDESAGRPQRGRSVAGAGGALRSGDTLCLRPRPPGSRAERYPCTGKRRETILTNESGPEAGVEGVVEDVKGRAEEAGGAVSGDESLQQ